MQKLKGAGEMQIVDGKNYMEQVKQRIAEYTVRLGRDLSFQDIDEELADPGKKYTPPEGELLVALDDSGTVVGMVAYHRHSERRCEMKRLYVAPECRGMKLGDQLVAEILLHARKAGFEEMVLDTVLPLQAALHLYHKMGFSECAPYYNNPMPDVVYMRKELQHPSAR